VLSYVIPQRISESDARTQVRFSLPASRQGADVKTAILHLVPYYRLTAEEITWQNADREEQRRRNVSEVASALGSPDRRGIPGRSKPMALVGAQRVDGEEGLQFESRVIDRSFLARTTSLVPSSLGVRTSALDLQLFDRKNLPGDAVVVSPDVTPRLARERALGVVDQDVHARALLRVVLQIVYFPFWMATRREHGSERVAVVDAVTGRLLRDAAEPAAVAALFGGVSRRVRVLGFRPLGCPNCGWDLPFRPDDVLFHCSSCERGWLARGERLQAVPFSVLRARGVSPDRHLPVWRLGAGSGMAPIFAPAFRCRRLKAVLEIGSRLTRRDTDIERASRIPDDLVGCALDEEDARALARFIVAGIRYEAARGAVRPALPESVDTLAAELLWLPFADDGYALREATTGAPVPRRLLDLAV